VSKKRKRVLTTEQKAKRKEYAQNLPKIYRKRVYTQEQKDKQKKYKENRRTPEEKLKRNKQEKENRSKEKESGPAGGRAWSIFWPVRLCGCLSACLSSFLHVSGYSGSRELLHGL
jgi:hypothetical protein